MSKVIKAVAALALIVGCVVWLLSYYSSRPEPGEPVAMRFPLACSACGKAYIGMLGKQPAKCHYCSQTAVWRAVKCRDCGTVYPFIREDDGAVKAACTKCKKTNFTEGIAPDELPEP